MLEPVVTTLVVMAGSSIFGFGALIAALAAGPHKLVVITMMLMMIAMQYARPNDFDF
ncbi:MAG TPA: hypothetical protein VM261_34830 [Kofleriaceae bacterium]|nr:hypothetical protein [Kofleriaceae bacterium]